MKYLLFSIAGSLLCFCGCSRQHPKPPLEQAELTARFFQSMEKKQPDLAIRQGRKLYALTPSADHILQLIAIQESNDAVRCAQKELYAGNIDLAGQIIAKAMRDYPQNHSLTSVYPRLRQLRNAPKLLAAMEAAKTSSGMRGARIAARAALSLNMTPSLERYLHAYERREAAVAAAERAATIAQEKAAANAEKKAHSEDAKLNAEEKHFETVTAAKSAANAEAMKKAGALPARPAKDE